MIVVGLTGSIGMGKTFAAKQFKRFGAEIFDADSQVHELMQEGGEAYSRILKIFPEAIKNKKIDRKKLGDIVFADAAKRSVLENILHPMVRGREINFIRNCQFRRCKLVVLDVPLLFETGADLLCDYVVVVVANPVIQKMRVQKNRGLSEKKFKQINDSQISTVEKIKKADFVIRTGLEKRSVIEQVRFIIDQQKG